MSFPTFAPALGLIASNRPTGDSSVDYARRWLIANMVFGTECPICDRHAEVYTRSISREQASALNKIYKKYRLDYFNVKSVRENLRIDKNKEITSLAKWNLLRSNPRYQGSWAVTTDGVRWIQGKISVPKNILTYQGEIKGQSLDTVTFQESCGSHVNKHDPRTMRGNCSSPFNHIEEELFPEIGSARFIGNESVSNARQWVKEVLRSGKPDHLCPACERIVAYNKTEMTDSKANLLIQIYRHYGTSFVHVPTFEFENPELIPDGYASESAHRGLLEIDITRPRKDRSGWYRITPAGIDWIFDKTKTHRGLKSFNRSFIAYGKKVSVREVVGFRYERLIDGLRPPLTEHDLFEN